MDSVAMAQKKVRTTGEECMYVCNSSSIRNPTRCTSHTANVTVHYSVHSAGNSFSSAVILQFCEWPELLY